MREEYVFTVDDSQFERITKIRELLSAIKDITITETDFLKQQLVKDNETAHELFHTFYLLALREHIESCDLDMFMYDRKLKQLRKENKELK